MLVKSKFLGDAGWKDLSAKNKLKDNGLAKALERLKRTDEDDHDEQTKLLEEVVKLAAALKKDKAVAALAPVARYLAEVQGDSELALRDVAKARAEHDKARKAKAEAEKAAAKKAQDEDDDEEESPELLTTKLKPLLKLVAKGETMHTLLAKSGKQVVVMLSRKPIPPARRKLLAEQLGGGSTKYYPGTCGLEAGATTFALKAEVAGMSKLVKAAVLEQTGLRLNKIKCRGEDGDDHDDDDDGPPDPAQGKNGKAVAMAAHAAVPDAAPGGPGAANDPAADSYDNVDSGKTQSGPKQSPGPDAAPIDEPAAVRPRMPTELVISPEDRSVHTGDVVQFKVTAEFSDNTSGPLDGDAVSWSSLDEKVFSIDGKSGKGTARDVGNATVIATWRGTGLPLDATELPQTTTITVKEKFTEVTINFVGPNEFKGVLVRGERVKAVGYALYAVGPGKVRSRELPDTALSSSDETVIEVKGGLVSALKAGSASLIADDEASGDNRSITVRVTEPAASPAPNPSGVPTDIAQPYGTAKQGYDNLMQQVRELDDVPRLVKSLDEIIRDLSHAQEDTVAKAQMAEQQNQQIQGIRLQVGSFGRHAESAKKHIEQALEEIDLHQLGQQVAELRAKAGEELKNIGVALSLVKTGMAAAVSKDPFKTVVELIDGLNKVNVSAWTIEANKLQAQLDARKHKLLLDHLGDAKKELDNAKQALAEATTLASRATALFNRLREDAENKFDAKAGAGSFKFAQLTKPLAMADKIVDQLMPPLQRDAETVNAAYTKLKRAGGVDLSSATGKTLQAMNDEALGWWKQAANVGRQADEHRKRLRDLRQQANTKLAFVTPGA